MLTNDITIKDASLTNSLNRTGFTLSNNAIEINRELYLSNYTSDALDTVWSVLCEFIRKNYEQGKGTYIKGFGTFTFSNHVVDFSGATNPYTRDKKHRTPVFIVSSEFNAPVKPGQHTKYGVTYYTQKQSNSINHVKLSFAELSYAISTSKEECANITKHLLNHISEAIRMNNFQHKYMPGIGELKLYKNILYVKFNDELVVASRSKPQKYNLLKKNMFIGMDVSNAHRTMADHLVNPFQSVENLRPSVSVLTKVEQSADEFMKSKLNVNIRTIPRHEVKTLHRPFSQLRSFPIGFINDKCKLKRTFVFGMKLRDMKLQRDVLEAFEYFKGSIIANMKLYDQGKIGAISVTNCINAIYDANVHTQLTKDVIRDIVGIYNKGFDYVEYMKFITSLLKDCKGIIAKEGNVVVSSSNSNTNDMNVVNEVNSTNTNTNTHSNQSLTAKIKEVDNIKQEIKIIESIIPELKIKHRLTLDQNISYHELCKILSTYNIIYSKPKIIEILTFLEIPNINAFTLLDLFHHFTNTKIISADSLITSKQSLSFRDDITTIHSKIKDVIYLNGGCSFLFANNKPQLTRNDFINILRTPTSPYDDECLSALFDYLVKTERPFTLNDYNLHFATNPNKVDTAFEKHAMLTIAKEAEKRRLTLEQYFDALLKYNINTNNKVISRCDFISIMHKEKFKFSAEDLDYIFTYIDTKKDNVIDKEEFMNKVGHELLPLSKVQAIIKSRNIDIEDIAHRMDINIATTAYAQGEKYNYATFKHKIRKFDNTLSNECIQSMFNSLKQNVNDNYIYAHVLLDALNVFKSEHIRNVSEGKPSTYVNSFKEHYMNSVRSVISYAQIKKKFEDADFVSCGKLSPADYARVLRQTLPQFSDDDHTKFTRITNTCDSNKYLNYNEWLNLIYYYNGGNCNDAFMAIVNAMSNELKLRFNNNVDKMAEHIARTHTHAHTVKPQTTITYDNMKQYIINELHIDNNAIERKTITKFDVDADGVISVHDLHCVLCRYSTSAYFKYANTNELPNINLYPSDTLTETKISIIIKHIKQYMKTNNMTEAGLFRLLDVNGDGVISLNEFNTSIDKVIQLAPTIKDQVFNYLDYYHNGLIDLETFGFRFRDYDASFTLPLNRNEIEIKLLTRLALFVTSQTNILNDIEMFNLLDKDNDGVVGVDDMTHFAKTVLEMDDERELHPMKIERVLQTLSLTKNKHVGLNDITTYINKTKAESVNNNSNVNECDVLKETTNQNLFPNKNNVNWINSVIERFGLFISEHYDSIEMFFNKHTERLTEKFTFEDFMKFNDENYKCFNDGFNLTRDELLAVFTSLDSHKKNYLTLNDLECKLHIFDFYKRMHNDIKRFVNDNFKNGVDAFKMFVQSCCNDNVNVQQQQVYTHMHMHKQSITFNEFIDAINYFFPHKYNVNTIMNYINKYFKSPNTSSTTTTTTPVIKYTQFNYIYFNTFKSDIHFLRNQFNDLTLRTRSTDLSKTTTTTANAHIYSSTCNNFHTCRNSLTKTPFDVDPLNKLKRIINSSKHDLEKVFANAKELSHSNNGIINKYQFRNILKQLNIGLTSIEIDYIMKKTLKTNDGNINLNEFITFIKHQDVHLHQSNQNAMNIVGEVKQLIYKYYSNPILCYKTNIKPDALRMDFETFKNVVSDMYKKEQRQQMNYTQIKSAYDVIDLRKDGMIDINEWKKAFGDVNGSLDVNDVGVMNGNSFFNNNNNSVNSGNCTVEEKQRKQLREWETSSDVCEIYKIIWKHKKYIRDSLRKMFFNGSKETLVLPENLIKVLKEIMPRMKLSYTQWKILVNIGKCEFNELIDIDMFFTMVEIAAKSAVFKPRKQFK